MIECCLEWSALEFWLDTLALVETSCGVIVLRKNWIM